MDWVDPRQGRDRWLAVLKTVIKLSKFNRVREIS